MNLTKLPTFKSAGVVRCIVESPQRAPSKYKYDPETKCFELSRSLTKGLTYPFDWGFIPSTAGPDGDPLDVMILHDSPTYPGLLLACAIIGVLEVLQQKGKDAPIRNDRIFAVPIHSHREDEIGDVAELPARLRKEIEQFFIAAAKLDDQRLEFLGWKGPKIAEHHILDGQKAFRKLEV
ncbi:MAG: inorganic diphosphatase [Polyangiaceae bacterium]|nr:inorganic diphosphatase [Polyangiaceae bacterium]